jgi:hypothetical protein
LSAHRDALLVVYIQHSDSRAADRCATDERWAGPPEMPAPFHSARMKKAEQTARDRINSRQVWAFMKIARMAGKCKVWQGRLASMLPRDNMLDLEGDAASVALGQQTVFAAKPGSLLDSVAERGVHYRLRALARS